MRRKFNTTLQATQARMPRTPTLTRRRLPRKKAQHIHRTHIRNTRATGGEQRDEVSRRLSQLNQIFKLVHLFVLYKRTRRNFSFHIKTHYLLFLLWRHVYFTQKGGQPQNSSYQKLTRPINGFLCGYSRTPRGQ